MTFWEIILISFLILILTAYAGVVIYFIVIWFVANKKSEGDRLKKARERKYKRLFKQNIKNIKEEYILGKVYVECSLTYTMAERGRADIEKWLKENNILYKIEETGLHPFIFGIKFLD